MAGTMKEIPQKIFTNKAIYIATFFGGPLAAGFLISKNYKVFGNSNAARNAFFAGLISTVIIFILVFAIPDNIMEKIPQSLIPFIYTGIIALFVEKYQGEAIKNFLKANGEKASGWTAAGYGAIGLLTTVVFILIVGMGMPFKGYEKKMEIEKSVNLYYSKRFSELEIERISQTMKNSGFFEGSQGADIFLGDKGDSYRLIFIVPDTSVLSDGQFISSFMNFEKFLNYNLSLDRKIKIGFTDITFTQDFDLPENAESTVPLHEPLLYLQQLRINDYQVIFYNSTMPESEVRIVGDAIKRLKNYFPERKNIDIIFLNNGDDYTIKFFVFKEMWNNPATIEKLQKTIEYIQDNGIKKKIRLMVVDVSDFSEKEI